MATITKTNPKLFDQFMDVVSSFQPCSIEQIRRAMKEGWGPVYSARNFALEYGFVNYSEENKRFTLSMLGERLLRFSGNLRNEFLVHNVKLQCNEPFLSLSRELQNKKEMTIQDVSDFLETKFPSKKKWAPIDKDAIGAAMSEWLKVLAIVS
jgi:hypothetical protein